MAEFRDRAYEDDDGGSTGATIVAWIALVLAVLALALGWLAYNRAGEDLVDNIEDAVTDVDVTDEANQGILEDAENGTNEAVNGAEGVLEDTTNETRPAR